MQKTVQLAYSIYGQFAVLNAVYNRLVTFAIA